MEVAEVHDRNSLTGGELTLFTEYSLTSANTNFFLSETCLTKASVISHRPVIWFFSI